MIDVSEKSAVDSSSARDIDHRMAEAFAAACMRVVLCEVEQAVLESTTSALHAMSHAQSKLDDWAWIISVAHGIHLFLPNKRVNQ